mmetsp:Transcript_4504/g.5220  ORF Transcript_4504/g.5220 Transcript_4504/m.5220 type:complete len:217 (-) Transcript_4504:304-954(-)
MWRALSESDKQKASLVPPVFQETDKDCGFAIVRTLLSMITLKASSSEELENLAETSSPWTIDLVYLLITHRIKCEFYSLQVSPSLERYASNRFYSDTKESDIQRLKHRAEYLKLQGVSIKQASLTGQEIKEKLIPTENMIIALVNASPEASSNEFYGHYILVIGFSYDLDMFFVRDPSSPFPVTLLSEDDFNRSRSFPGTDEDLIVVDLSQYPSHI